MHGRKKQTKRKKKSEARARPSRPIEPEHLEAPVTVQEPPLSTRRFWPTDEPLPDHYVKARHRQMPCAKCRRVLLDDLGQAVVCTSSGKDVAWFRCKVCGHRWPMAVKEV